MENNSNVLDIYSVNQLLYVLHASRIDVYRISTEEKVYHVQFSSDLSLEEIRVSAQSAEWDGWNELSHRKVLKIRTSDGSVFHATIDEPRFIAGIGETLSFSCVGGEYGKIVRLLDNVILNDEGELFFGDENQKIEHSEKIVDCSSTDRSIVFMNISGRCWRYELGQVNPILQNQRVRFVKSVGRSNVIACVEIWSGRGASEYLKTVELWGCGTKDVDGSLKGTGLFFDKLPTTTKEFQKLKTCKLSLNIRDVECKNGVIFTVCSHKINE